jgi:hypothetical protein
MADATGTSGDDAAVSARQAADLFITLINDGKAVAAAEQESERQNKLIEEQGRLVSALLKQLDENRTKNGALDPSFLAQFEQNLLRYGRSYDNDYTRYFSALMTDSRGTTDPKQGISKVTYNEFSNLVQDIPELFKKLSAAKTITQSELKSLNKKYGEELTSTVNDAVETSQKMAATLAPAPPAKVQPLMPVTWETSIWPVGKTPLSEKNAPLTIGITDLSGNSIKTIKSNPDASSILDIYLSNGGPEYSLVSSGANLRLKDNLSGKVIGEWMLDKLKGAVVTKPLPPQVPLTLGSVANPEREYVLYEPEPVMQLATPSPKERVPAPVAHVQMGPPAPKRSQSAYLPQLARVQMGPPAPKQMVGPKQPAAVRIPEGPVRAQAAMPTTWITSIWPNDKTPLSGKNARLDIGITDLSNAIKKISRNDRDRELDIFLNDGERPEYTLMVSNKTNLALKDNLSGKVIGEWMLDKLKGALVTKPLPPEVPFMLGSLTSSEGREYALYQPKANPSLARTSPEVKNEGNLWGRLTEKETVELTRAFAQPNTFATYIFLGNKRVLFTIADNALVVDNSRQLNPPKDEDGAAILMQLTIGGRDAYLKQKEDRLTVTLEDGNVLADYRIKQKNTLFRSSLFIEAVKSAPELLSVDFPGMNVTDSPQLADNKKKPDNQFAME